MRPRLDPAEWVPLASAVRVAKSYHYNLPQPYHVYRTIARTSQVKEVLWIDVGNTLRHLSSLGVKFLASWVLRTFSRSFFLHIKNLDKHNPEHLGSLRCYNHLC